MLVRLYGTYPTVSHHSDGRSRLLTFHLNKRKAANRIQSAVTMVTFYVYVKRGASLLDEGTPRQVGRCHDIPSGIGYSQFVAYEEVSTVA